MQTKSSYAKASKEWYESFFLDHFNIELLDTEEVHYCANPTYGINFTKEVFTIL